MTIAVVSPQKKSANAARMPNGQKLRVVLIILIARANEGRFQGFNFLPPE
jgi:hypothetical protein